MDTAATLYVNGKFFTMDREAPRVQSVLVRNGRIEALGPLELVQEQAGTNAKRVDLEKQAIVPGFNDCHCHILSFGLTLDQIDVGVDTVQSIADIINAIGRRLEEEPGTEWVIGRGYDQNALAERRHPSRHDLDTAGKGRPVVLWHTSGHALACNSRALELAGISAATRTPSGGDIERDSHGEPTGVLKEAPAMDLLARAMPLPTIEQGTEAIIRAMETMARQGITSASDAATGLGVSIDDQLTMYRKALESGRLVGRITVMPQILYVAPPGSSTVHSLAEFEVGNQPQRLHIGPTKIFSDGALTTRTAALRQPYTDDPDTTGLLIWDQATLLDMITRAHGAGWQIATHAIGDRAVTTVVYCYEQALQAQPRGDHRHRIEHCMFLNQRLAQRIQQAGILPVVQPGFISRLGDAYIAALGIERASQLIPMQLFDILNIPVAFSSDRPVIPGSPVGGIAAAVSRKTPDGVLLGPEHTISTLEAIRHYTAGSAYATHLEGEKGVLRRGMLADFTVLSPSPTEIRPQDVGEVRVIRTVVGGEQVYAE